MKELKIEQGNKIIDVKVNDGATICWYSDRTPVTIIEIEPNGKWIKVQEDNAKRLDKNGMSDCQDYEYSRNNKGRVFIFKRTRKQPFRYTDNGNYFDYGCRLVFGYREKYFDYCY